MDLSFVLDHLRQHVPGLRVTGGAAQMSAAMQGTPALPALFVLPLRERTTAQPLLGRYRETDVLEFGVMLCASSASDGRGHAALGQLHSLREAVRQALSGWAPVQCAGQPMSKTGGRLERLDGGTRVWWLDSYSAQFVFEKDAP